jgi:hypothetical protein
MGMTWGNTIVTDAGDVKNIESENSQYSPL